MKRRICIVTGSRADYGHLRPVMMAVKRHPGLELQVIAAGMHLMPEYGNTYREVEKDGIRIDAKVKMSSLDDSKAGMARSLGDGIVGMTHAMEKLWPDIVVVLGDRIEAFAAAIAAGFMEIPVAHIHGGDITTNIIDGPIRHSITRFAHIHFAATRKSAGRLVKFGEQPWRIHTVGAPGLDDIVNGSFTPEEAVMKKYSLKWGKPIVLAVQHPTLDAEKSPFEIREILDSVTALKCQCILIYPNADAGGRDVIKAMGRYGKNPLIQIHKSLPKDDYLGLMRIADVMLGNSSSGIIESPSFRLPVVNVGMRQQGREEVDNANVINLAEPKKGDIEKAIRKAMEDKNFRKKVKMCRNPYDPFGDGNASGRIAKTLSSVGINERLLKKNIVY